MNEDKLGNLLSLHKQHLGIDILLGVLVILAGALVFLTGKVFYIAIKEYPLISAGLIVGLVPAIYLIRLIGWFVRNHWGRDYLGIE